MDSRLILKHLNDLSVFEIGMEACSPGHHYSCMFPERFLIHYVASGKGIFRTGGKEYKLEKGNVFFIGNQFSYYEADKEEPWTYMWIHFSGKTAEDFLEDVGLGMETPVYMSEKPEKVKECFDRLMQASENEYFLCSLLFNLFGTMKETNTDRTVRKKGMGNQYVEQCCEFIHTNYYRNIGVNDMCTCIGLEYSYLIRLFKKQLSISPGKYLQNYRLSRGRYLLKNTAMSINDIASSVGYEDRTAFSKAFSKKYGESPCYYREKKHETELL